LGKDARILGSGAFGTVFAGALPDGRLVAIKQMELASAAEQKRKDREKRGGRANPYTGEAGFQLELEVLSKYVHPNLVQLIGHCIERKTWKKGTAKCSIVLEYMACGSLLMRLRPAHAGPPLSAQERFDIAADVARGLHYLHAEASPPLIHQDVKSDNILLADVGGRLVAKVADFGTARMAPQLAMNTSARAAGGGGGKTHHSTGIIIGTTPYMPAEVTCPQAKRPPPAPPVACVFPHITLKQEQLTLCQLPATIFLARLPVFDGGAHLGEDGHLRVWRGAARVAHRAPSVR
jgi:serine/threonine protein kinase